MTPPTDFLDLQTAMAGRFSLDRELGRGGMGIVYLARDVMLERPVAIKLLLPELAKRPDMRRRFLREARIAAQCFHPHIVPIHSVEESGDLAFFVMAYVRGETLAERLRRAGPLNADAVARVGREVGWALAYSHERGVIHRDVKPENILLEDGSDRALIADFGIAVRDDPLATPASGEVVGTARFMAPEQALGEIVDGRADLYALGVTLFVAATGRYPHDGRSALAVLAQQSVQPAPSVRTLAPTLPPSTADAIDRCMAHRPGDRFADAMAFVAAMEPLPAALPVSRALQPVHASAAAARSLLGWTIVALATTQLFVLGEGDGIGAVIIQSIGGLGAILLFSLAATRAAEALLAARRALGSSALGSRIVAPDLVRALAGDQPALSDGGAARVQGIAMLVVGALIAGTQHYTSAMADRVPDVVGGPLQFAIGILPPLLIGVGAPVALRGTRVSRWLHDRIVAPMARRIASWMGAPEGVNGSALQMPINAPTEVRLDYAARDIIARLPTGARDSVRDVPQAAAALARHAELLREEERQLAQDERAIRVSSRADHADALARVAGAREQVRAQLASSIAALESIRLDLLRLEANEIEVTGITSHLDVVRDLQRHVDAHAEVRALLQSFPPQPTPV